MIEGISQRVFDDALRLNGRKPVLGLPDEFRFADEDGKHADAGNHHIVGGYAGRAFVLRHLGVVLQPLGQRDAKTRLVRAAFRGGNGIAIGMDLRVAAVPGDRPFQRAVAACLVRLAGKNLARDGKLIAHRRFEIIFQAAGEMEDGLFRNIGACRHQFEDRSAHRISTPPKR